MHPITIRLADPADAEFLVRGNASMALETEHLSLDLDRLRDGVHALFDDTSRGLYYIAEVNGRRAGQMMITYEWSDWRNGVFWWIQSVWVEPELRGRGIFKALYAHVEALARANQGVCGLRLYVEQDNERAQATYERCGMKRTAYQMFEADFVLNRGE
ncbi:GNAT family N-acetyltransferase [uncultured Paludibaculum sp.]|uniref:GNAT family N-acetyltransferase n=1 Tax=uncultured Paludibaculum sp. TaxID=1765020 RepID=UPI002AAC2475|nr:GNAT family N-acetyltransferase [uncultured Paludibaculum sp.]